MFLLPHCKHVLYLEPKGQIKSGGNKRTWKRAKIQTRGHISASGTGPQGSARGAAWWAKGFGRDGGEPGATAGRAAAVGGLRTEPHVLSIWGTEMPAKAVNTRGLDPWRSVGVSGHPSQKQRLFKRFRGRNGLTWFPASEYQPAGGSRAW